MTDLQKPPIGVLGALGLKIFGKNPDVFSNALIANIDVYDQYLLNETREVSQQVSTGATQSSVAVFLAPVGQIYRVLAIGSNLTLAAGDAALTATLRTTITSPSGSGVETDVSGTLIRNGNTLLNLSLGKILARPLILPPGVQLNLRTTLSAVPGTVTNVVFALFVQVIDA